MTEEHGAVPGVLEWATAGAALDGQLLSGDFGVVVPRVGGALVATIDALGHGADASASARIAAAALRAHKDAGLEAVFGRVDEALLGRRGVVMTVALVEADARRVTWAGLGDVEAAIVPPGGSGRTRIGLSLRGGTLGEGRARPRLASVSFAPGDLLVMATDGVQPGFVDAIVDGVDVRTNAAMLLRRCAIGRDDALVLVARFL